MSKVRIAIVGVGNCASSLVQGLEYYKDADPADRVPGLMHVELGGYHIRDVEVVGRVRRGREEGRQGRRGGDLHRAEQHDPLLRRAAARRDRAARPHARRARHYYREMIAESDEPEADVVAGPARHERRRADLLPAGRTPSRPTASTRSARSTPASAFVNALPVFIASDPTWAKKFADAGVPIVGDDIKSQVGATITHRVLAKLFEDRGVELDRTYQLNFGGNMDFMNMLERERLTSKKISKTQSVQSQLETPLPKENIHIGPQRPRAVARGPQVGDDPPRGPQLRRRAAHDRDEARGVGLAELGRRRSSTRCAARSSRRTAGSAAR